MLEASALFNEKYYLAKNPQVANDIAQGLATNPFDHFNRIGKFQGLDPSPLFDTKYYLANNTDVSNFVNSKVLTAFDHFIEFGQEEGRSPSVLYNEPYYLSMYPDVKEQVDSAGALRSNRDILTGIQHFVKYGLDEGRKPSPVYNENYYFSKNSDLPEGTKKDNLTGIEHLVNFGIAEGRKYSPFIDSKSTLPNGVASGDVTASSSVLWTRTTAPGVVLFEYSTDPQFTTLSGQLTSLAQDPTVPVKVQATSLNPNTQYYYRVTDAAGTTATGKFRTLALVGTKTGLRFGVSADWQGQLNPYPAVTNVPDRNLDFFALLGDNSYVDALSPDLPGVRQSRTIEEFRTKHNEGYTERFGKNTLADLRASTPVYVTWDDHEITNDFAGGAPTSLSPQKENIFGQDSNTLVNQTPVFKDALQAFVDYQPMRNEFYRGTNDPRTDNQRNMYRYNTHGSDAATFVLDMRSFRDVPLRNIPETADQATVDKFLQDSFAPNRNMLGQAQLQQLKNDLLASERSGVTWKFVMSTVPMQHFGIPVAGDRWEAYSRERTEILKFIQDNNIKNVVFVTGDFHGSVVNNVTYQEDFGQPQIPTDTFDVMVGPIGTESSGPGGVFAAPFGEATVRFTPDALLSPEQKSAYFALATGAEKDQFVKEILDKRTAPLGYSPVGLADSNIDAQLIKGDYIAAHNYGWTEFDIDRNNQSLTVTVYGVKPYTQAQLETNPTAISSEKPEIINQFVVNPK